MYYQIEGYMNMETITFEEESQGGMNRGLSSGQLK